MSSVNNKYNNILHMFPVIKRPIFACLIACFFGVFSQLSFAHSFNLYDLYISEKSDNTVQITWMNQAKQPLQVQADITPACNQTIPPLQGTGEITVVCQGGLAGRSLALVGPGASKATLWLRRYYQNENTANAANASNEVTKPIALEEQALLAGDSVVFQTPDQATTNTKGLLRFIPLGMEHILLAPDHLAFIAALLLLAGLVLRRVMWAVFSFTLAHATTLALGAFNLVNPPAAVVEALIAFSIMSLAAEAVRRLVIQGRLATTGSLTTLSLAGAAFVMGLVHGLGFAGALSEFALPTDQRLSAVALFNVGVELGQVIFILIAALCTKLLIRLCGVQMCAHLRRYSAEILGVFGAYWFIERLLIVLQTT